VLRGSVTLRPVTAILGNVDASENPNTTPNPPDESMLIAG